jgi:two-component system response regulator GlrR
MQVRIIRTFADFINDVDLSRVQVGDVITVPAQKGEMLIAEGWAVAHARRPTVLVVDDEVSMLGLLTLRFEAQGYRVESATSVDDAILILHTRTIDAIVLDVRMPGRPGLDLLRFVRTHENLTNLPVLILTGAALSPDEEAIVRANPAYIFYKQESLEDFETYLDRLTGHRTVRLA